MQMRCYRCGWSFALKKEEIVFAIEALEESGGTHYDVRCQRCRHTNKISLEQLKKFAPRVEEAVEAAEEPAEGNPAAGEPAAGRPGAEEAGEVRQVEEDSVEEVEEE